MPAARAAGAPSTIHCLNQLFSPAAALGSAATLGVADFTGGVAGRRSPPPSVAIGIEAVGFLAAPLAVLLLPTRFDALAVAFAFAGGAVGGLGLIAFYRAMSLNLIGVVSPITAVVAAALPVGVGVINGERLHTGQLAGIAVGLVAIVLLNAGGSRTGGAGARTAIGLAVLAGIGFGMFFVLFHSASSAGVTAFVSGRFGSATASMAFALLTRVSPIPARSTWRLIGFGGMLDGVGVVLYLYATFHGLLSLSAVLTSFYPAFTVLSARIVLRERMSLVQAGGAIAAIAAVVLIAAT